MRNRALIIAGLLATTGLASPAVAQSDSALPPRFEVDDNGVNLATGAMILGDVSVSIGNLDNGLSYNRFASGGGNHPYVYALYGDRLVKNPIQVVAANLTLDFNLVGGIYVNQQGSGETLTVPGLIWTLTLRDGTIVTNDQPVRL